jgi:hypothetical protein
MKWEKKGDLVTREESSSQNWRHLFATAVLQFKFICHGSLSRFQPLPPLQ